MVRFYLFIVIWWFYFLLVWFGFVFVVVAIGITCSLNERLCLNFFICVEDIKFCDGRIDCFDGSDEGIGCRVDLCEVDNGGCF